MDLFNLVAPYLPQGPLFFTTGVWNFGDWEQHLVNLAPSLSHFLP